MAQWQKTDWRKKPRIQMPDYTDQDVLKAVEGKLAKYPPLVFAGEARSLKLELANYAPPIIKEITISSAWVFGDARRRPNSKCYYDKRGSKAVRLCFN